MGKLIVIIFFLGSFNGAHAGLVSPFHSTVEGFTIPNTHYVDEAEDAILRGMAPNLKLHEFLDNEITDVLIFKNETFSKNSHYNEPVKRQIKKMQGLGYKVATVGDPLDESGYGRVYHLDFRYKDIESFETACRQIIDGLHLIDEVSRSEDRILFFHCTVGEDRTGVLAGLNRMLTQNWDVDQAFNEEMCRYGFGAGNKGKVNAQKGKVLKNIRTELTPVFLKMAYKIHSGYLDLPQIRDQNYDQCSIDPGDYFLYDIYARNLFGRFECETSPVYPEK